MRSNASPSNPSPSVARRRGRGWAKNWPEDILLPALIAITQTLAITPLLYIFFGEDFGLSGGRPVMWPGGLALLGLASFWLCRFVMRLTHDAKLFQATLAIGWLVGAAIWIGLEPVYGLRGLLAEPGSLVGSRGYLVGPLLLSLGIWWQGIRYATIDFLFTAEEIRGSTQRSWLILIGSLVFAALLDNDAGSDALSVSQLVIPLAMVASVALVSAAEVHTSRREITRTGGRPPTWTRWSRLVSGVGIGVLTIAAIVLLVLTPGAFATMIDALVIVLKMFGQVAAWLLYGVLYLIYYIIFAISELLRALFDVDMGQMEQPAAPMAGDPPQLGQQAQQNDGPWKYSSLLRWGVLGLVVLVVILLLFRMTQKRSGDAGDEAGDEERSSVFSADLAKAQLRDLLRRRNRGARIPVLNLDDTPAGVRESWRYLQVLAIRQDVGRHEAETPRDFSARLRAAWPGTASSLNNLASRYERSRYGDLDTERDRTEAQDAWRDIYRRRKDVQIDEENA